MCIRGKRTRHVEDRTSDEAAFQRTGCAELWAIDTIDTPDNLTAVLNLSQASRLELRAIGR